jgi:hypothetical protein
MRPGQRRTAADDRSHKSNHDGKAEERGAHAECEVLPVRLAAGGGGTAGMGFGGATGRGRAESSRIAMTAR